MKKVSIILAIVLVATFSVFAIATVNNNPGNTEVYDEDPKAPTVENTETEEALATSTEEAPATTTEEAPATTTEAAPAATAEATPAPACAGKAEAPKCTKAKTSCCAGK